MPQLAGSALVTCRGRLAAPLAGSRSFRGLSNMLGIPRTACACYFPLAADRTGGEAGL